MVVINKEKIIKSVLIGNREKLSLFIENMFTSIENTKYFQKAVKQINLALSSDTKGIYKS